MPALWVKCRNERRELCCFEAGEGEGEEEELGSKGNSAVEVFRTPAYLGDCVFDSAVTTNSVAAIAIRWISGFDVCSLNLGFWIELGRR